MQFKNLNIVLIVNAERELFLQNHRNDTNWIFIKLYLLLFHDFNFCGVPHTTSRTAESCYSSKQVSHCSAESELVTTLILTTTHEISLLQLRLGVKF